MITYDLTRPRERELFAQLIAELQAAEAAFEVEERSGCGCHSVTLYFLTRKGGDRI